MSLSRSRLRPDAGGPTTLLVILYCLVWQVAWFIGFLLWPSLVACYLTTVNQLDDFSFRAAFKTVELDCERRKRDTDIMFLFEMAKKIQAGS